MHPFEYFISFPKMIDRQNLIPFDILRTSQNGISCYILCKKILIEIMKLFTAINNLRRSTKVSEND